MEESEFVIEGSEEDRLRIQFSGWERPDATDVDGANRVEARVAVANGAFRADYECSFHGEDLRTFHDRLVELRHDLEGKVALSSVEKKIEFEIEGDGLGRFEIAGRAVDEPGSGHRFWWHLKIDQTALPGLLESMDAIVRRFPVRGE